MSESDSDSDPRTGEESDSDSDIDDTDDATVMGSTVAYAEVEASIQALRYGGGTDSSPGKISLLPRACGQTHL